MAKHECSFGDLCDGSRRGYACDYLIDITRNQRGRVPAIPKAEKMLLKHLYDCVQQIEEEGDCELEYFYIGKTYVREWKETSFDHMDGATWNLAGIYGRWWYHSHRDYGKHGLVVLAVVTEEAIHPRVCRNKPKFRQEDYALALESRLIQDCLEDPRLYNDTWMPGRRDGNSSIGYALYMAFKV